MPASRSARAITFAPRSCPSSPGLAITTLSRRIYWRPSSFDFSLDPLSQPLDDRHFFVLAPRIAQGVAHLAKRSVGADGVENRRHQVFRGGGGRPQPIEGRGDAALVARLTQAIEF